MKFNKLFAGALMATALTMAAHSALAAGFLTNGLPAASLPLTGLETLPADTNLTQGQNPASESISVNQLLSGTGAMAGTGGWRNALIGGDFGTNLFQRGASGTGITNTATYTADRWAVVAGSSGSASWAQETGATDVTEGYAASLRVQRASANTDVNPVCVAQVLTSSNSTRFQGQTAEFSFHLLEGANFSGANGTVTATIGYGTGTDQSMANFVTGAWTGYAAAGSTSFVGGTAWKRYSVVAAIPYVSTNIPTQVGVKLCYTPVGTAGTNDWFEFTGAQLDVNPGAQSLNGSGSGSALSFERRPASTEATLQQAYYWTQKEVVSGTTQMAVCQATSTTVAQCVIQNPVLMRAAPTPFATLGTLKVIIAGTATAATAVAATTGASTAAVTGISTTVASGQTAGQMEILESGNSTGGGVIGANSEL